MKIFHKRSILRLFSVDNPLKMNYQHSFYELFIDNVTQKRHWHNQTFMNKIIAKEKGDSFYQDLRKNEMERAITQESLRTLDPPTYFHFFHSESKKASLQSLSCFVQRNTRMRIDECSRSKLQRSINLAERLWPEAKACQHRGWKFCE